MAETEKRKAWVDAHKEQLRAYNKEYRKTYIVKNGVENSRKHKLKTVFGITPEQYDIMLGNQNYSCLICKRHQTAFQRRLAVDHCHTTNKVRGLLCSHCNLILGHARDDIKVLETAIQYLKENQ